MVLWRPAVGEAPLWPFHHPKLTACLSPQSPMKCQSTRVCPPSLITSTSGGSLRSILQRTAQIPSTTSLCPRSNSLISKVPAGWPHPGAVLAHSLGGREGVPAHSGRGRGLFVQLKGKEGGSDGAPRVMGSRIHFPLSAVAHPIRPKPPSATSIPAILKALQDEWVSPRKRTGILPT